MLFSSLFIPRSPFEYYVLLPDSFLWYLCFLEHHRDFDAAYFGLCKLNKAETKIKNDVKTPSLNKWEKQKKRVSWKGAKVHTGELAWM